jgi:hypothetical protein
MRSDSSLRSDIQASPGAPSTFHMMGGDALVTSEIGKGSTFVARLPAAPATLAADQPVSALDEPPFRARPQKTHGRGPQRQRRGLIRAFELAKWSLISPSSFKGFLKPDNVRLSSGHGAYASVGGPWCLWHQICQQWL